MEPHNFFCLFRSRAFLFSVDPHEEGGQMARKCLKSQRGFLRHSELSFTGCGRGGVWWDKLNTVVCWGLSIAVGQILFSGSSQ